jgi:hypothetical protein
MKMSRAVLSVGLAFGLCGAAWAGAPATGLGQQWPNAADLSRSPHYHVYTFDQNGVRFIQVNGLNGTVLGAIGTAGDQFIVLPIGNATQVSTPQQSATSTSSTTATSSASEVVYQDASTVITATPQSNGTAALTAATTSLACGDPTVCNSHSP